MPKPEREKIRCFMVEYQQIGDKHLYRAGDGREWNALPPPGAMWYVDYLAPHSKGPDGRSLMVMTPGGAWCVDAQASNCTMKHDIGPYGSAHRCWIRHGPPPDVTVDKKGHTCKAGKGSIKMTGYHGYLRNGYLT